MMLDVQNLFSDQQVLTSATANVLLSSNTIDLLPTSVGSLGYVPTADIGRGNEANLFVQLTADVVGATSLLVELIVADNAALTTNPTVVAGSGAVPVASLKAGYRFGITSIPPGITKRYAGLRYTFVGGAGTGGAATAGAITAGVTLDR